MELKVVIPWYLNLYLIYITGGICEVDIGRKEDLPVRKHSGNDGFIRCFVDSDEPGVYNVTYQTHDEGSS